MMALSIVGGALAQLPLGKLSDKYDRRLVILGCMLSGTVIAGVALLVPNSVVFVVMFFFGASVMSLQALSLALGSDHATGGNFMEVGTGLMMTNAAGSAIGPLLTSLLMYRFGPEYFFISHFAVLLLATAAVAILIKLKPRAAEHPANFTLATSASAQAALQLDSRADNSDEDIAPADVNADS
jgi:MFS family permease